VPLPAAQRLRAARAFEQRAGFADVVILVDFAFGDYDRAVVQLLSQCLRTILGELLPFFGEALPPG